MFTTRLREDISKNIKLYAGEQRPHLSARGNNAGKCAVFSVQSAVFSVQSAVFSVQSALCSVHGAVCSV